jgi:type I restriction enzyme M protein
MVECLDPQPGMSIYDPTCGSGGMLLEAVQYLKDRGQDVRALSLYGQEKNLSTWAIAQINLFLHDIDDAFIAKGDTILNPKRYEPRAREFTAGLGAYDRVLANPPFSEKVWGHEVWDSGDPFGRDAFGCPPKGNGDMAFVQHMLASTSKNGRVGVVIPPGVLFRGDAEGRIRQAMLRSNVVDGLIGLAPNLFYGTPVPAAILFLRRRSPDERTIRIVNAAEIFRSGKAKNRLEDSDVQYLTDAYRSTLDIEHVAKTVSLDDIANNDYNLNIDYFVPPKHVGASGDVNSTLEELKLLISRRNEAEFEMFEQLRKAGYEQ